MLLVDAVYLAVIVTATGGPRSELLFLFSVHLVAVTLLGGHRTGLRIALWDSFLLVAISASALDGDINRLVGGAGGPIRPLEQIAPVIAAFWLVAVATAFFSSLNERELRGSREELRILAAMGADLEFARSPDDVINVVLARTAEAFAFRRGAVLLKDGDGTRGITADSPVVRDLPGGTGPDAVVDEAWQSRGPVLVKALDAAANPMLARLLPDASNVVVLPLTAEGEPLGALAVEWGGAAGSDHAGQDRHHARTVRRPRRPGGPQRPPAHGDRAAGHARRAHRTGQPPGLRRRPGPRGRSAPNDRQTRSA